jgi:K+-sensing histidine kinase KdpD
VRELRPAASFGNGGEPGTTEEAVARWVFEHGRPAGRGTDTLPTAGALYLPLLASGAAVGVLAVRARNPERFGDPEQMHLLETFGNQIAAVIERANVADAARRADQALEMSRLKSEFVSTASHELRTPLTSLALNIDLLDESLGPATAERSRELLQDARDDTARLRALADDLLDLAKLEAGRMAMHLVPVPVAALIEPAVAAVSTLARRKGLRVTVDVRDSVPHVRADAARINTVLTNLLTNALQHTNPGGTVLVTAEAVGDCVQVSVADSGAGIPLEEQGRLFEKFARPSSAGADEGTGLGLAIARQIVLAHDGLIWVDSGPGPGSVFSFTLPLADGILDHQPEDEHASEHPDRR